MTDKTTQEVAKRQTFDPIALRSLSTLEDARRLIVEQMGGIVDATTEIGDGFTMVDDKKSLLNTPMLIIAWVFAAGDFGDEFVVVRAMTERGDKVIFTDGSTGISRQLREYEDRTGRAGGMMVPRGLRVSEYDTDANGQPTSDPTMAEGRGATFYLNV